MSAIFQRLDSRAPDQVRRPFLVGGLTLGTVGGLAAMALLVAALLPGSPTRPTSSAAVTLAHLADTEASQPAVDAPGPGQYQYTESEQAYESCYGDGPAYCYLLPEQRQIWIGADGSGRLIETLGVTTFPTSADRTAWIRAGSPPPPTAPSDTTIGPGPHSLSDGPPNLASLPTDPECARSGTVRIEDREWPCRTCGELHPDRRSPSRDRRLPRTPLRSLPSRREHTRRYSARDGD